MRGGEGEARLIFKKVVRLRLQQREIRFVVDAHDAGRLFALPVRRLQFDVGGIGDTLGGDQNAVAFKHGAKSTATERRAFGPWPGEVVGLCRGGDADQVLREERAGGVWLLGVF